MGGGAGSRQRTARASSPHPPRRGSCSRRGSVTSSALRFRFSARAPALRRRRGSQPHSKKGRAMVLSKPLPRVAFLALASLASGARAEAQATKLNAPFPSLPEGTVSEAHHTQDGRWVLYLADQDTPGVVELYRHPVPGWGTGTLKLNAPLASGGNVSAFLDLEWNGQRLAVYRADQTAGVSELFAVSILEGGTPQRLSGSLVAGGDVGEFQVAGSAVYFLADAEVDGRTELYRTDLASPLTRVKLSGTMASGRAVTSFQIAPDSSRVLYRA